MPEYRLAGVAETFDAFDIPEGRGGTDGTSGVWLRNEDGGLRIELAALGVAGPPIDFLAVVGTALGRPDVRVAFGVGPPVV